MLVVAHAIRWLQHDAHACSIAIMTVLHRDSISADLLVAPPKNASLPVAVAVLVILLGVGYLDAVTGYELSVFLLYILPVALAAHFMGLRAGVATALLACLTWAVADRVSGHRYSHDWYFYVNAMHRLACFLLAVVALRFVALRGILRKIGGTRSEQVPVCQQCHRLGANDGYWRSIESYFSEIRGTQVQRKVCPDCARRVYARRAYLERTDDAV
jgi:hypothetical protein